MGSLFSAGTQTPTVPTVPTTYVQDEINNVETVPVKNSDGSVTYITRAMELTPEEQAEQDKLDGIMQEAMDEIVSLSSSDYNLDENSQKIVQAWEDERRKTLEKTYDQRTTEEEKLLARRGLSDSSAGLSARRQRQLDKQDAEDSLGNESNLLESDIRGQQLSLQQNLYNLASAQTSSKTAGQQQAATKGLSLLAANSAAQQASLADYYNYQSSQTNSSLFGKLATIGLTAGGYSMGGTAGASAGLTLSNSLFSG